ncbi:MAG: RluA family pseudouridine synthase [SAR324 cluster bacterium]|nr:RluA family pseudouridine synthase [SAR324 cluster bacterium]
MSNSKSSSFEDGPSSSHRLVVQPGEAGLRLDKLLSEHPKIVSREMARRLIEEGAVILNQAPRSPSTRVRENDVVEFQVPPPATSALLPQAGSLHILYEDSWLAVLDKSAGTPMHPGPGHAKDTLVNYLLHHCSSLSGIGGVRRPGIVHRLDKDTSGVVVVAKHDRAHQHLAAQFQSREIGRAYVAVVIGQPPRDSGIIDLPLARHPTNRLKRVVQPGGKRAVTHWRIERRVPPFSLLRLRLETGRTHQIRVHLARQNWPVVGDPLYGGARHRGLQLAPPLRQVLERFNRQALHACQLAFDHPESGERLHFESPLPEDMQELIGAIDRHCQDNPEI